MKQLPVIMDLSKVKVSVVFNLLYILFQFLYDFLVPTAHNAATSPINLHATDSPATLPTEHSESKLFIVHLLSKVAQWFEINYFIKIIL